MLIYGVEVEGVAVDERSGCAHWRSPRDLIAIRFPCCDRYYACYDCHLALADHPPRRWTRERFDEPAVLCAACGARLTIRAYLASPVACPRCGATFNPGCIRHHALYFEVESGPSDPSIGAQRDA